MVLVGVDLVPLETKDLLRLLCKQDLLSDRMVPPVMQLLECLLGLREVHHYSRLEAETLALIAVAPGWRRRRPGAGGQLAVLINWLAMSTGRPTVTFQCLGQLELGQACTVVLLELGILAEMLAAQYLLQLSMPAMVDSIEMVMAKAVGVQLG